jgi:hypothetical protein
MKRSEYLDLRGRFEPEPVRLVIIAESPRHCPDGLTREGADLPKPEAKARNKKPRRGARRVAMPLRMFVRLASRKK